MTSFGDVNVGDKVRLTLRDRPTTRHEIIVKDTGPVAGTECIRLRDGNQSYYDDRWSVEVLEPAPKPLPSEIGFYRQRGQHRMSPGAYLLAEDGEWRYVYAVGIVNKIDDPRVEFDRVDLERLVPVSAIEEARAEVVKEIVDWLRKGAEGYAAQHVESKFGGRHE